MLCEQGLYRFGNRAKVTTIIQVTRSDSLEFVPFRTSVIIGKGGVELVSGRGSPRYRK